MDDERPEWRDFDEVDEAVQAINQARHEILEACDKVVKDLAAEIAAHQKFFVQSQIAILQALNDVGIIRGDDHWDQLMEHAKSIMDGEDAPNDL